MTMNKYNTKYKQSGVVLVIGLLMLLVITMVGVTAMSGTTSNERMTANHQFQSLSFQAAESAIRDNFNIPAVVPAVTATNWFFDPAANNYNVAIKNGAALSVQADANIQFCGEELPAGSGFCNGMAGPCDMDQVFDVRGQGIVSALGSQQQHLRRGARPMIGAGMPFDTAYCMQVP
jgi:hypothetical protein